MTKNFLFITLLIFSNYYSSFSQNSFSETKRLAKENDPIAQYNLGLVYYNGEGVPVDKKQALKWFMKSANQGQAEACFYLGLMNRNGEKVKADKKQAFYWFNKGANLGDAYSQHELARMYWEGSGTVTNKEKAAFGTKKVLHKVICYPNIIWERCTTVEMELLQTHYGHLSFFRKSAQQGYMSSQYYLGYMYFYGQGTEMDRMEALYWYKKSAEQGHMIAQSFLGVMYRFGDGIPINKNQSFYGSKKLLSKVMHMVKTIWVNCILQVRVQSQILLRPSFGSRKVPNKMIQKDKYG
ncbi:MAG: sel1 repeat family protein [Chloroflexia bacterium]|nr:sel1 repeat family protein [Chloroflexia bacterium]